MRVLVADQEPEMLEVIARAFEVDVATSKATCVDLLRANHFDVIVACERLSDGSGLELLSHVGQRWPHVIRILAIEPERRAMLRGRLGPFKLFETLSYPIDEDKLEAALARAAQQIAENEAAIPTAAPAAAPRNQAVRNQIAQEQISQSGRYPALKLPPQTQPPAAPPVPAASARQQPPAPSNAARQTGQYSGAAASSRQASNAPRAGQSNGFSGGTETRAGSPQGHAQRPSQGDARRVGTGTGQYPALKDDARRAGSGTASTSSAPSTRNGALPSSQRAAAAGTPSAVRGAAPPVGGGRLLPAQGLAAGKGGPALDYPPLPSKGSKIVPLGSPIAPEYRILRHDYQDQSMPGGTLRSKVDGPISKEPSLQEKAAALASEALTAVFRAIKPQTPPEPRAPERHAPRRKK